MARDGLTSRGLTACICTNTARGFVHFKLNTNSLPGIHAIRASVRFIPACLVRASAANPGIRRGRARKE
jgi:hypothetical protein